MTIATGTPVWADLQSTDRKAARAFYSELFGWDWEVHGEEMGNYANASADGGLVAGELGAPAERDEAMWNLYLKTEDIQAATALVGDAGGSIVAAPTQIDELGWMGVYTDPTGVAFGLWQPGSQAGFDISPQHGHPCWFEVGTPDAIAARDFYARIGGGLETEKMSGMEYWTLHADGRPRAGVVQMTEEWGDLPPGWMVYFAVDDCDAAFEQVKELGGEGHHEPFDTPFGRMAIVSDPQGATFVVLTMTQGGGG